VFKCFLLYLQDGKTKHIRALTKRDAINRFREYDNPQKIRSIFEVRQ
jgi:hypothetical protein